MDHDECDPSELETFLQSCLDSANATLLDAEEPLAGGVMSIGLVSSSPLGALSAPAPVHAVSRTARQAAAAPLPSLGVSSTLPAAGRAARVPANGVPAAAVAQSAPLLAKPTGGGGGGGAGGGTSGAGGGGGGGGAGGGGGGGTGGAHKPLNGVLMVPTPVHAAASPFQAAPARTPLGPQPSPVPAASPFSAARSPGQSPAPTSSSPVSLPPARVVASLPQAVVPGLPQGVILSQAGGVQSMVGSSLITGGTIVPTNGLQMVGVPHNGAVMQLMQGGGVQAVSRAGKQAGKQPQLLPKTLAPNVPMAKPTLAQPPMMLASGGLGCGGGGPMVLTPVVIPQPGGGHQIQYILREQPNLLFPTAAGGGKAAPQHAVLLPTAGGGQTTVLLQQPSQLQLQQTSQLLQPTIRLLAPQQYGAPGGPALYAVASQQPMLGGQAQLVSQQLQLAAQQQQELLKPMQLVTTAQVAARRAGKKKRRDEPAAGAQQPQKKAFVDLEDIMKKSGIFGDMDDEPGLHTEPDIKAEAAADGQPLLQPLQGGSGGAGAPAADAAARLPSVLPLSNSTNVDGHDSSSVGSQVLLNGAALVPQPQLASASMLSATMSQPVLSYAAGPGRPLLAVASQPLNGASSVVLSQAAPVILSQAGLLQALPRMSAAPMLVTAAGGCQPPAGSVLSSLLSQPSRLPRPAPAVTTQPTLAAPAGTVLAGGLSFAVPPQSMQAVGGGLQPATAGVAMAVPRQVAVVAQPASQNAFFESLIKNQLCARTNVKKKKKDAVTKVSIARAPTVAAPARPAAEPLTGARVGGAPLPPRLADNCVTSTTAPEPPPPQPPLSRAATAASLPQTSFTAAAEPVDSAGAARPLVPSVLRAIAPAPFLSAGGGASATAGAVARSGAPAAFSVPAGHKVQTIQLSAENQQELNRVQIRMQLLVRADRTQRDAEELKRLEAARQKILATGQQVTLPVRWQIPTSTGAAAVVLSPSSALTAPQAVPQQQQQQRQQQQQQQQQQYQQQQQQPQQQSQSVQSQSAQAAARGIKRSQEPCSRFLQQLACDQRGALEPDTETPFRNAVDAVKRLSKYHVLQDAEPPADQLRFEDDRLRARAEYIQNKRTNMYNKYRRLLLKDSMRLHPSPESIQLLRYLNQHDREQLDMERRNAKQGCAARGNRAGRDGGDLSADPSGAPSVKTEPAAVAADSAEPCSSRVEAGASHRADPASHRAESTPHRTEPVPHRTASGPCHAQGAAQRTEVHPARAESHPHRTDTHAHRSEAHSHRIDPSIRDVRLPAAASASAADAAFERLFDEPLVNGHADGARLEDDLNEQVQSAIKSILSIPREAQAAGGELTAPPPVPSRFNINASFFNADAVAEDNEALDEAVRSILL